MYTYGRRRDIGALSTFW